MTITQQVERKFSTGITRDVPATIRQKVLKDLLVWNLQRITSKNLWLNVPHYTWLWKKNSVIKTTPLRNTNHYV